MTEIDGRSERNKLTAPIMQAFGSLAEREEFFIAVTGKSISEHRRENGDSVPIEVLQTAAEALPGYLAERDAKAQAEAEALEEEKRRPGGGLVERIRRAIFEGKPRTEFDEPATPVKLAEAQALADAETLAADLAEQGAKERAKAARELEKRQKAALNKVRADLPVEPPELAESEAKVLAAVDEYSAAIAAYARRLATAKIALAEGGVVERPEPGGDVTGIDWDNHGHKHANAVTIDGILYSLHSVRGRQHRIEQRVKHAGGMGGAL
jgi:hypothetical protein